MTYWRDMANVAIVSPWLSDIGNDFERLRCILAPCDTTVIGSDGKLLRAHSAVLAASSQILKHQLAVCVDVGAPLTVNVDGVSGYIWGMILRFMYTGESELKNAIEAKCILHAGEVLGIEALSDISRRFMDKIMCRLESEGRRSVKGLIDDVETLVSKCSAAETICSQALQN